MSAQQELQGIAVKLVTLRGQLKSSARQALAAVGEIDVLLALLKKIESQGN